MCSVVLWQHEEPTKTIQIAVVRMPGSRGRVRLGWKLGNEASGRGDRLLNESLEARARNSGGRRARLASRPRRGAQGEAKPDERHAPLHDQEMCRHLTEPPIVVRPGDKVGVGCPGDPNEEAIPLGGRTADKDADRLPEPRRPVRRVIHDPEAHRRIMRSCAFVQNAARTNRP